MKNLVTFCALFFLVACATPRTPADPPLPKFVTVNFLGATISPTKTNGERWDGPPVDPANLAWLAEFLPVKAKYKQVLMMLARLSNVAWAPPDPKGFVQIANDRRPLPKLADTFTPTWRGLTFRHVALDPNTELHLHLVDSDVAFDDPIGDVTITESDLVAAFRTGQMLPVNVQSQSGQILFVQIEVYADLSP